MAKAPKLLSYDEIQKLLAKLPNELKLDLVQFGLDLIGIVNPAADVANAGISLWRGDFFGAAISAISIIPIGDVLKIAKLGKYAKTFETLVTRVVPNNPALYKELAPVMEQFRSLLAKVPAGNASVEKIRDMVNRFFRNAELHRLSSGAKALEDWASFAKKRGRWKDPAYAKRGTSPEDVVDRLMNAAENGGHTSLRINAKAMIQEMGKKDWVISAGPHRTSATAGGVMDKTPHITLEIAGQPYAYHVRLDHKGNIWEIRTMLRVDGKVKPGNPVPGSPRPWRGPGQ
jgi:hypothetical protein